MTLQPESRVLFIGDSITDDGRFSDPEGIGYGYVRLIRDLYTVRYPDHAIDYINKGISGNRVVDLAARWQSDVVDVQPDIVSISIGVNDVWRQLDKLDTPVFIEQFESTYRHILTMTRDKTHAQIVLMETSVIGEYAQSEGNLLLAPYNECIHRLAKEYAALLVPIRQACFDYLQKGGSLPLTNDGVHLTSVGKALFAETWLRAAVP